MGAFQSRSIGATLDQQLRDRRSTNASTRPDVDPQEHVDSANRMGIWGETGNYLKLPVISNTPRKRKRNWKNASLKIGHDLETCGMYPPAFVLPGAHYQSRP